MLRGTLEPSGGSCSAIWCDMCGILGSQRSLEEMNHEPRLKVCAHGKHQCIW